MRSTTKKKHLVTATMKEVQVLVPKQVLLTPVALAHLSRLLSATMVQYTSELQ